MDLILILYQAMTRRFVFRLQYQPTKVPQMTTLKRMGKINPVGVNPLNKGFPVMGATASHSHKVGRNPTKHH